MNKDLDINQRQQPLKVFSPVRPQAKRASSLKATLKFKSSKQSKTIPVDNKPDVKIFQDVATQNMKNLKQVKFLNVDDNQINQLIDAKPILEKTGQLAKEYLAKKQTMDVSVMKVINASKVAHMEILKKNEREKEEERKRKAEERSNSSPLVAGLLGTLESENTTKNEEQDNKIADGFVRSNRNVALRVKSQIDIQMEELEASKNKLMQKLNDALVKLDALNTTKRQMSEKLVEQIQFVRDLHRATGGAGVEDIQSIVSNELRNEYKREQELHKVLDDQLTRADQERTEILERLKLFTGEKEVVVINQDGQRQTFKVTSVNIERVMNDIKATKADIAQVDHAISRAREVLRNSDAEMQIKERQIQVLSLETNKIFDSTQELNLRHDHAVVALQNEKRRSQQMHKMHVKLLSMRIFEETMQKVLLRNRELAFEQLQRTTEICAHKSGAVFAFRKVLLNTQYKYARRLLQHWYQKVCDPANKKAVITKLPSFYGKQELVVYFYFKWRALYQAKSERKMQLKQGACRIFSYLTKLDTKTKHNYFYRWRSTFCHAYSSMKLIISRLVKNKLHLQQDAMDKWRRVMFDQTFNARLQSLTIQFNEKQMERLVFSAWQEYVTQHKNKIRSLKHRVVKNLRVNVARKKFLRLIDDKIKILHREQNYRDMQKVLNAFKYFKQNKLLRKTMLRIDADITPSLQNVNGLIHEYRLKQEKAARYRAICALVIKPTYRLINECLSHWQTLTVQAKWKFTEGTKLILLRIHKDRLQLAFNRWRTQRSQIVIQHQQSNIADIDQEINQIDQKKADLQAKIDTQYRIDKALGSKQLRKLCERALLHHLHYQFLRWRSNCALFNKQQSVLAHVCKSYQRRFLRMAWSRYLQFVVSERINYNNQYKLRSLDQRKQTLLLKTVFKSILVYSKRHIECTAGMRHLVKTIDRHNARLTFKKWDLATKKMRENHLFQTQRGVVSNLDQFVDDIGNLQNEYQKTNQTKERLVSILKLQGKEIMKKWFIRFHYGGMQYGFKTWQKTTLNIQHRNKFLLSIVQHLEKNTLRQSFSKWLDLKHIQIAERINSLIAKKELDLRENQFSVTLVRLDSEKRMSEIAANTESVRKALSQKNQMFVKTLETLVGTRERNFCYNKLRLYLNGWRQFTTNRNKSCQVLARGLTRMCLQKSFNLIIKTQQEEKRQLKIVKASARLDQIVDIVLMRKAMNSWRCCYFLLDNNQIEISRVSTQQQIEIFNREKVQIQSSYIQKFERQKERQLQKCSFLRWNQYVKLTRFSRQLTEKQLQLTKQRQIRTALLQMHQRAQLTIRYRQLVKRQQESNRQKLLIKCLNSGFRAEAKINRQMCSSIDRIFKKIQDSRTESAFQRLLQYTDLKNITQKMDKTQSTRILAKLIDKMLTNRLRFSIEQLRLNSHFDKANYLKLKSCLMIKPIVNLRKKFMHWKLQSLKKSVVLENEDGCGPVNLEAWNYQLECTNLKNLMREDGQPAEQIASFEQNKIIRDKQLLEKCITRMMIYQDDDLRLMPYFFDKLRKYAILRKRWRPRLNFIDKMLKRKYNNDQSLLKSFKTWQKAVVEAKKHLEATQRPVLVDRFFKNRMIMNEVAEQVEEKIHTIDLMTEQRDVLFKGYVGSQRLAISYTKDHFIKIQQKVLMKINDQGVMSLQTRISAALAQNLSLIERLKNRIAELEAENSQRAQHVNESRPKALEAVHGARDVKALQAEIDRMRYELTDSTNAIKRLIADNQYLKQRLDDKLSDNNRSVEREQIKGLISKDQLENYSALRNQAPTNRAQIAQNTANLNGGSSSLRTTPARAQITSPQRLAPTIRK